MFAGLKNQRNGFFKSPRVDHQIPIFRHSGKTLNQLCIQVFGLLNDIRRLCVIDHGMSLGVTINGGATQPFQNTQLNFLRPDGPKPVKALRKTVDGFTRQAKDQVGVQVRIRMRQ